jgi:hypothetical protein
MLLLPNGQIMLTNWTTDVEIFTPDGTSTPGGVAPTIGCGPPPCPLMLGQSNVIFGLQMNGLSQANMYGDDFQDASNFPIVQLSTDSACTYVVALLGTSSDFVLTTDNYSRPNSIQAQNFTGTHFTPTESGTYYLNVIANGIPSNCIQVRIP